MQEGAQNDHDRTRYGQADPYWAPLHPPSYMEPVGGDTRFAMPYPSRTGGPVGSSFPYRLKGGAYGPSSQGGGVAPRGYYASDGQPPQGDPVASQPLMHRLGSAQPGRVSSSGEEPPMGFPPGPYPSYPPRGFYPVPTFPPPKPPTPPGVRAAIAIFVTLSLLALAAGVVAGALIDEGLRPESGFSGSGTSNAVDTTALQRAVVRLSGTACEFQKFGTGFFVDTSLVVTNAHVVAGVSEVLVEVQAGRVFKQGSARAVYYDPGQDVAVLRTDLSGDYLSLALRDPQPGSVLVAPGFPRGESFQVKSATFKGARELTVESIYGERQPPRRYLLVDSSLEPGNSGGPLLDSSGAVVGMATAVSVATRDIGIAVPHERVAYAVSDAQVRYAPVSTGSCYTKGL